MAEIGSPVSVLPPVSSQDVRRLSKLGIETVADLLLTLPYGLEAYGEPVGLGELRIGQMAMVMGTVSSVAARRTPRRGMRLTEATLQDEFGRVLKMVWFNQPYIATQLARGQRVALAGTVRPSRYGGLEMQNPHLERLGEGEGSGRVGPMMPKYHLTGGLTSRRVLTLVEAALPLADSLDDTIPAQVRDRLRLLPIAEAVRRGHRPSAEAEWRAARHRMAFAELLELQVSFLIARRRLEAEQAAPIPFRLEVMESFKAGLGFELTRAQRRAAWEIFKDQDRPLPMNRLLNGDVGSGKTAVAAAAVAMAHAAGRQSVVMAPTEILARQHLHKFRAYLEASFPGLSVDLLVSGLPAAERRRVTIAAASGHTALLVGTHALIEEAVELADLGLAVVDEQHRFGTRQRELLRTKGRGRPHFLAMTATPIPRSLALALCGEMALSVLDELPPGRLEVETSVIGPGQRDQAYRLLREQVRAGRQAFVICPLVEESETLEARAATAEYERLRTQVFPDLRLSLVHGRMKDKDTVMRAFAAGESDLLVATPVVEVGVDVPNATVMMIEGAERFGLAQLHQFRGRVGRGAEKSHCLLYTDDPSEQAQHRLRLLAGCHDGFRLAEEDMRMRGAGELMGARQHGMSDLAMQGILHPTLLSEARQEAERIMAADPELSAHHELRSAVLRRLATTSLS